MDEPEIAHKVEKIRDFPVVDFREIYVIAEAGAYFNLPARKEGIIPGAANLRLPRFLGEGRARDAIMFDRRFSVESPEAKALINDVPSS